MKFCQECDNILIPRKGKLFCQACNEEFELNTKDNNDYNIVKTLKHDEKLSAPIIIKAESLKGLTLEELKALDCGEGEQIPTLKELIGISKGKIGLQLEIKASGFAEKIVDQLKEADIIESTIVSSFDHKELLEIQKFEPKMKLASLVLGIKKNKTVREALENRFYAIHPFVKFANLKFINIAHENNIKVNVWTVDLKSKMRKLINIGVDGLITNDVEAALEALNRDV